VTAPLYFAPIQGDIIASAAFADGAYSKVEVDRIEALARELVFQQAKVATGAVNPERRISRVAWLPNDSRWGWLYQAMHGYVQQFNLHYGFDVWGFHESMQYLEYGQGGHFDWHVDAGVPGAAPRKLSFTLQLSDPASYDGGDLEVWGADRAVVSRARGTLICFPSFVLHRVTPVTRGMRRAIVAWATGEPFR